jgi:hypothetical protein
MVTPKPVVDYETIFIECITVSQEMKISSGRFSGISRISLEGAGNFS